MTSLAYGFHGDYLSGYRNNSLCAIYLVTGNLAIRLFIRSNAHFFRLIA